MSVLKEQNDNNIKFNEVFMDLFGMDLFDDNFDASIDDNLLGKKFKLKARDLVYLLFDIEKKFDINITNEDLDENDFNTIANILNIISKKVKNSLVCRQ